MVRAKLISALLATIAMTGCYDAEALRKQQQAAAANLGLEELDLGAFRITLPHILGDAADSTIDFHAFGQIALRDRQEVAAALETRGPELRSRMLLSIRGMRADTFEEPKLNALRKNIAEVVNAALEKKAVKNVGFYSFTFTTM